MISLTCTKCLFRAEAFFSSRARFSSSKNSPLAKLRKSSGYPFSFCREALAACSNNYEHALNWLSREAASRGFEKADKLRNRPMSQGLLGLMHSATSAVVVEVNCETDFVARNHEFQSLVAIATEAVHQHFLKKEGNFIEWLYADALNNVPIHSQQKTLSTILTSCVSSIGENMAISRAVCVKSSSHTLDSSLLMSYCHKTSTGVQREIRDVQFGKYSAIVQYKPPATLSVTPSWRDRASKVSLQLCQHIVGMSPRPGLQLTSPASDPDDEKCIFLQKFLLDETVDVGTLLTQNEIQLENFLRIECGKHSDDEMPKEDCNTSTIDTA